MDRSELEKLQNELKFLEADIVYYSELKNKLMERIAAVEQATTRTLQRIERIKGKIEQC